MRSLTSEIFFIDCFVLFAMMNPAQSLRGADKARDETIHNPAYKLNFVVESFK
ncbi:hypothetical protein [Helicobacter rodentium]|uniref:hypothetical protein n=1 Tax=Helicobacter rodentium TaxID=59617 RepID=UPI0012EC7637|nr:hypothetical protein [Helicobacter rodentium]